MKPQNIQTSTAGLNVDSGIRPQQLQVTASPVSTVAMPETRNKWSDLADGLQALQAPVAQMVQTELQHKAKSEVERALIDQGNQTDLSKAPAFTDTDSPIYRENRKKLYGEAKKADIAAKLDAYKVEFLSDPNRVLTEDFTAGFNQLVEKELSGIDDKAILAGIIPGLRQDSYKMQEAVFKARQTAKVQDKLDSAHSNTITIINDPSKSVADLQKSLPGIFENLKQQGIPEGIAAEMITEAITVRTKGGLKDSLDSPSLFQVPINKAGHSLYALPEAKDHKFLTTALSTQEYAVNQKFAMENRQREALKEQERAAEKQANENSELQYEYFKAKYDNGEYQFKGFPALAQELRDKGVKEISVQRMVGYVIKHRQEKRKDEYTQYVVASGMDTSNLPNSEVEKALNNQAGTVLAKTPWTATPGPQQQAWDVGLSFVMGQAQNNRHVVIEPLANIFRNISADPAILANESFNPKLGKALDAYRIMMKVNPALAEIYMKPEDREFLAQMDFHVGKQGMTAIEAANQMKYEWTPDNRRRAREMLAKNEKDWQDVADKAAKEVTAGFLGHEPDLTDPNKVYASNWIMDYAKAHALTAGVDPRGVITRAQDAFTKSHIGIKPDIMGGGTYLSMPLPADMPEGKPPQNFALYAEHYILGARKAYPGHKVEIVNLKPGLYGVIVDGQLKNVEDYNSMYIEGQQVGDALLKTDADVRKRWLDLQKNNPSIAGLIPGFSAEIGIKGRQYLEEADAKDKEEAALALRLEAKNKAARTGVSMPDAPMAAPPLPPAAGIPPPGVSSGSQSGPNVVPPAIPMPPGGYKGPVPDLQLPVKKESKVPPKRIDKRDFKQ